MLVGCDEPAATPARCGPALLDPRPEPRWVRVAGVDELAVFVDGASTPIAGRMAAEGEGPAFRPTFPFSQGVSYQVRWDACEASFDVPRIETAAPEVVDVYPRSATVPENILRFYVYFSRPMAEGRFLDHIRLEHVDSGEDLTGVFFDNIHELWSPDRRRITLLVDPGRVKTGLQANVRQGRAFRAGDTYRLHILGSWSSIDGQPLSEPFVKTYRAIPEDRDRVDADRWDLTVPMPGSLEPLVVAFDEPVDHVSVQSFLSVRFGDGTIVEGRWTLHDEDRTAHFQPASVWDEQVGAHRLMVHGRFEDIAGNNLNAAFDHTVGDLAEAPEDRWYGRALTATPAHASSTNGH